MELKSYPVYCSGFFAEHQIRYNFNYYYMLTLSLAKPNYFHCYSLLQTFTGNSQCLALPLVKSNYFH
jgi:hypothetical protein